MLLIGKPSINIQFSMAMLNNQMVPLKIILFKVVFCPSLCEKLPGLVNVNQKLMGKSTHAING